MNTVIFSIYDCGYKANAVFVSDYVSPDAIKDKDLREVDPLCDIIDLSELPDIEQFEFFEKLFGKRVDRIIIIKDAWFEKAMTRVAGDNSHAIIFNNLSKDLLKKNDGD